MESQPGGVFKRVFGLYEGTGGRRRPVGEPCQEKPHGRAEAEGRQGFPFRSLKRAHGLVTGYQRRSLGEIVFQTRGIRRVAFLEGPGIEADGKVIGQGVSTGEIEVYGAAEVVPQEEGVIREEIGMDGAARKISRKGAGRMDPLETGIHFRFEARLERFGVGPAPFPHAPPGGGPQGVFPVAVEVCERDRSNLLGEIERLKRELSMTPTAPVSSNAFAGIAGIETEESATQIKVRVPGDVLFASGSIDLRNESKSTLNQIANVIQREYPGNTIRVEGHTDTDPIRKSSWKDNLELSLERSAAVHRHLQTQGIDPKRMYAAGFGEWRPQSTKDRSRRVTIVVVLVE